MKLLENYRRLLEAEVSQLYKSQKIFDISQKDSINFCNWVQINGWNLGLNGNYFYTTIDNKKIENTPNQLYILYLNNTKQK